MTHILLVVYIIFLSVFVRAENQKLILSIVPQLSINETYNAWKPLVDHLEKKLNIQIDFKFSQSIPEFEKYVIKNQPDLVFMNPYHIFIFEKTVKYKPIIRSKTDLVGILAVDANSRIQNVKELDGKTISFPAPNAFAASLYMRALLEQEENIHFKPIFSGNHSNAYRSVLYHYSDAVGGVMRTYNSENDSIKNNLKIIFKTKGSPSHPLAVHPRLNPILVEKISQTILDFSLNERGSAVLEKIISKPVSADYVKDYERLKKLNLKKYIINEEE